MEFIKEEKAFRHYNAAGEMDAEIDVSQKEKVRLMQTIHLWIQAYADKELHVN